MQILRKLVTLVLAVHLLAAPGHAVEPGEILPDPALEARARTISAELRCLVCQNQSVDDSNAPLARDLRLLVRERLKAGDTDQQVLAFIVARYGEFVLLRPPFNAQTALLWLTPLLVLGAAILVIARRSLSAPQRLEEPAPLTAAEEARVRKILGREKGPQGKS
jgi:cytochrome c-type biogenesis protein CcmH